jgi:hypothetical protein
VPPDRINPDQLYSPRQVGEIDNICQATVYNRMAVGEYGPVFKDGRKTQITGQGILGRRAAKLKPASFKAPKLQGPRFRTINQQGDDSKTGRPR